MHSRTCKIPAYTLLKFFNRIRRLGVTDEMDGYETRRIGIFNLINFFGLVTGIILPVTAFLNDGYLPPIAWFVAVSPAFVSLGVLLGHYFLKHHFALLWYFTFYPLVTSLVYINSIDAGIELFFIFYAVLAVFFVQEIRYLIAAISFSLVCFIMVYIVKRNYEFVMADINYSFFVFNHVLALLFIFGGLFLIKKENIEYQAEILESNNELYNYNVEIEKQKEELLELNNIKTKMFSVISHDVRLPLYGLRNLFKGMHDYNLSPEEIKNMLPEVVKDLTNTTDLMENLLQWAKSQMKGEVVAPDVIDLSEITNGIFKVLRLQAEAKQIQLTLSSKEATYAFADKGMMETVIRNLVSNAIKFTPQNGSVQVSITDKKEGIEVQVSDTGVGMDDETMKRIFSGDYFTTKGTSNESGTGLGLMICNDFIRKNDGTLSVESTPGAGTSFTFTVPKA